VCRPWLHACRLCALVAEVSRRWRALYVHLPPRHEVRGAGEGSPRRPDDQPGELLVERPARTHKGSLSLHFEANNATIVLSTFYSNSNIKM